MNIGVVSEGKSLDSQVSEKFEKCVCLLIVNMNDLSITAINNDESSGENLTNEILKYDCEAVILGNIDKRAFDILADACVTRYYGVGHSVKKALELMKKGSLKLIKNHDGTNDCSGHHH
ncbi:NifB/NifX family molybdenum-iron cluster-binding protein [Clostridium sp. PL3]|uniref:NifB/NifX family molybdenum-iron cluster-binding protein n=1 Tax=Clostridium thailandense TaxID=2794346 RepID=A0A949TKQ8_9CLOT|nr:NifB/NifX family molybdenum-iron cluster-binding protein [Clostridium thailandense]MBV7274110.1 NifB/NifX family molybdenum-iron cluster-binding protein [Clostridium thailandense]